MEDNKKAFLIQKGVDVDKGIENTMDFATYDEILLEFCDSFKEDVNKFNEYKLAEDLVNYEIIVHALKSNCRTLGFMDAGEMFYAHELASKQNDLTYINEHYQELLNEVRKVEEILDEYKVM